MDFMKAIEDSETVYTENGAKGYKTSGHSIVDLNFKIPSYRTEIDKELFDRSLKEDKNLTLRWLLYLRDIRGGVGERKSFREFLLHLFHTQEDLALKFLAIVPIEYYGRWDDIVWLFCQDSITYKEKCILAGIIRNNFNKDRVDYLNNKPISLLAKWLPSENASSKKTKEYAKKIRAVLGLSSREYRKALSILRKYIDVVERKMSNNEWGEINYSSVPSRANLLYGKAFLRHDIDRRFFYLQKVKQGVEKINANALFLHDIVHKYGISGNWSRIYLNGKSQYQVDETLEQLWASQTKVDGFSDTLVVRDGSASMGCTIGKGNLRVIDVADAITLYCCDNNKGIYKDKFITFSSHAKVVDVSKCKTLCDKLIRLNTETDCSNTNIADVFNLVLTTAINNHATQEDLPKRILIVSDMEFDGLKVNEKILFARISQKYKENGYTLPKLVFWNVNSRTNVVPIVENENGLILLSGFSKNLMELVMCSELDPFKALSSVLHNNRYDVIDAVIK